MMHFLLLALAAGAATADPKAPAPKETRAEERQDARVAAAVKANEEYQKAVSELDSETKDIVAEAAREHIRVKNATRVEAVRKKLLEGLRGRVPQLKEFAELFPKAEADAARYRAAVEEAAAGRHKLHMDAAWKGATAAAADTAADQDAKAAQEEKEAAVDKLSRELNDRLDTLSKLNEEALDAQKKMAVEVARHAEKLIEAGREQERAAKHAMREAIRKGAEAARAAQKARTMDEHEAERMRGRAEHESEGHEHAIENAGDRLADDLEEIYGAVKRAAHHAKDHDDEEAEQRSHRVRELRRGAERVKRAAAAHAHAEAVAMAALDDGEAPASSNGVLVRVVACAQVALVGFALYVSRLQGARVQPQPLLG